MSKDTRKTIPLTVKRKAVQELLEGKRSKHDIAKSLGVSAYYLDRWKETLIGREMLIYQAPLTTPLTQNLGINPPQQSTPVDKQLLDLLQDQCSRLLAENKQLREMLAQSNQKKTGKRSFT